MQITSSTNSVFTNSNDSVDVTEVSNGTNEFFEDLLNNSSKKEDEKEVIESLVNDVMSLYKTGFTIEELEEIEKLLKELQPLLNDKSNNQNISTSDIDKIIKKIEMSLMQAQEKATGRHVEKSETNSNETFETRIANIQETIQNIKNGSILKQPPNTLSSYDELKLLLELKQAGR